MILDDQNDFGVDFQLLRDKEQRPLRLGKPATNRSTAVAWLTQHDGGVNGEFKFDTGG